MDWTLQDTSTALLVEEGPAVKLVSPRGTMDVGVDALPRVGSCDAATQTSSVDCALLELARAALGHQPINVWVLETMPVEEPPQEERTYATLRTVQADSNGWPSPYEQPTYATLRTVPLNGWPPWDERFLQDGWARDSIPDAAMSSVSDDDRSLRSDMNLNFCSVGSDIGMRTCSSDGDLRPELKEETAPSDPVAGLSCGSDVQSSVEGSPTPPPGSAEEVFTCKLCNKRFTDQLNYKYHKRLHKSQKPFTCVKCNQKFAREKTLERHKLTHLIARTRTQAECPLCGKAMAGRRDLKKHLAAHHDHTGRLRYHQFKCHICAISLATKHSLRRHLFIHSGQKPFGCTQCGKTFAFELYLRNHLKKHFEAKPFACTLCDEGFCSKRELKRHAAVHRRQARFQCNVCDKAFKGKSYFKVHLKSHTEEKKFRFVCDVCGEGFHLKYQIRAHLQVHAR